MADNNTNDRSLGDSRSPQSARRGNADPVNIDNSPVELGMSRPTQTAPENRGAAENEGDKYKPLYEPR